MTSDIILDCLNIMSACLGGGVLSQNADISDPRKLRDRKVWDKRIK